MFAINRSIVILLGINKRSIISVRLDQFSVRQSFYDHFVPYKIMDNSCRTFCNIWIAFTFSARPKPIHFFIIYDYDRIPNLSRHRSLRMKEEMMFIISSNFWD